MAWIIARSRNRRCAFIRQTIPCGSSLNYTPQEFAKLYSFPSSPDAGQGQCIAIIELGGGFRQSDLNTYFGPKWARGDCEFRLIGGRNVRPAIRTDPMAK